MKKENKLWLPLTIGLGALIVVLFITSIIVKNTAGKHEVKNGTGEIVKVSSKDNNKEDDDYTYTAEDASYEAELGVEILSKVENPDVYMIDKSPRTYTYTEDDLSGLTAEELYYALYEIDAKAGCTFEDAKLQAYFDGKNWYSKGTTSSTDYEAKLATSRSTYDKKVLANIEFIKKYIADNNLTFTP